MGVFFGNPEKPPRSSGGRLEAGRSRPSTSPGRDHRGWGFGTSRTPLTARSGVEGSSTLPVRLRRAPYPLEASQTVRNRTFDGSV
jgi:hypothetical protein